MSKKYILLSTLVFLLSFIFVLSLAALEPQSNTAVNVQAGDACVFMPVVMNGGAGAMSAVSESSPEDDFINPSANGLFRCLDPGPDFNGDGYADLAIGTPNESVTDGLTYDNAGAVQVIYGTAAGLSAIAAQTPVDDQIFHRGVNGLDDIAVETNDWFGSALAIGDFNDDGYDDLGIGVPGSFADGHDNAGVVQVLYGSASGLQIDSHEIWSQDTANIEGVPEAGDNFGASLTAGDFNDDGFDDLAVGTPREDVLNPDDDAGAINVIYGTAFGLSAAYNDVITQNVVGFNHTGPEENDQFGLTLTTGDFNGDGRDDLAVGTPYEGNGVGYENAGSVQIFFGRPESGLVHPTSGAYFPQHIRSDDAGIDNAMEENDYFGWSLAAADFNNDGYDDLGVGVPYETHGAGGGIIPFAGAVNVIYGSNGGLDTTLGAPIFHQGLADMDSQPQANEFFGWSLTAADFDQDGYADLAIGVPYDKLYDIAIGSTHILKGSAAGITDVFDKRIYDGNNPELNDGFGWSGTAADFNGDGYIDLATGVFSDDPTDLPDDNVGSVFVNYSDGDGVSQPNYQYFYQGHNGLGGAPEPGDQFGKVLP